jgi:hypothetical protein
MGRTRSELPRQAIQEQLPAEVVMLTLAMYEWGQDPNCLIFEIRTCMGVVVRYGNVLYGIHVPDDNLKTQGRTAFTNYLAGAIPGRQAAQTRLYSLVNSKHRRQWEQEMMPYGRDLGVGRITMVSVERFLRMPGQGADAATEGCVIACHLDDHDVMNRGCHFTYLINTPYVPFNPGGGGQGAGLYDARMGGANGKIPVSMAGWHNAEDADPNAVWVMRVR